MEVCDTVLSPIPDTNKDLHKASRIRVEPRAERTRPFLG